MTKLTSVPGAVASTVIVETSDLPDIGAESVFLKISNEFGSAFATVNRAQLLSALLPDAFKGVELEAWRSTMDGVPVLQIDTGEDTGHIRVNVNDAPVFDADPETGKRPESNFWSFAVRWAHEHRIDDAEAFAAFYVDNYPAGDVSLWTAHHKFLGRND